MTDYTTLTDKELVETFTRLWRNQMYYMAAEGNWSAERKEREENDREYWACEKEVKARNIMEYDNV